MQHASSGLQCALVAQGIERSPAKAEVVGSNPAKRASPTRGHGGNATGRCAVHATLVGG